MASIDIIANYFYSVQSRSIYLFSSQCKVMSLPVSQYEALLAQVRGLRRQAQHVQQLVDPLLFGDASLLQVKWNFF